MSEQTATIYAELVNQSFGEKLAFIRRTRRISQADLGRSVGLSRGTISNLESGIQNVQLHQIFKFALALDAPVTEFVPLMKDVVVHEGSLQSPDKLFIEFAKRQLIDVRAEGDDDENA